VKTGAERFGEALAPWLALADAALNGAKTNPGRSIAINEINAAAVIGVVRARHDFPAAARSIGWQRDFEAATRLGHQVAQVIHALASGAAGPLPVAVFHRDGGRVNIHVKQDGSKRGNERATVVVSGFEAVDAFLNVIEGIEARRIRRCELAECARFFWAVRGHSRCCCKAHTALCRLRRYRAKSKDYELHRQLNLAHKEYEQRRTLKLGLR